MKRRSGKGLWIVLAMGVIVFVAALFFLLRPDATPITAGDQLNGAQVAAAELAGSSSGVDVTVSVDMPKNLGDHQEFSGAGSVDFANGLAGLTYDLSELPNAAGAFGQLNEFDVVYESETAYVEIFGEGPRWVSFASDEVVGQDLDRLREVVLSNPLALPGLVSDADFIDTTNETFEGVVEPANAGASDEAVAGIFEALVELGVDEIAVTVVVVDSILVSVDYRFSFPFAVGIEDEVTVDISVDLSPTDGVQVEVPSPDQVRAFSSFF